MKSLRLPFLFLILNSTFIISHATITINSVNATSSTCPNNGTATIFASSTSNSAVFLYNIISGPVLYPLQNDSTFSSLYPGTYIAWVHDLNSYDSAQTTFTITGNYKQLAVTLTPEAPFCGGDSSSLIIANTNGTGLAPFTMQILEPFVGTPQVTNTLDSLVENYYEVKVTDACDNAITQWLQVDSGGSGFGFGYINLEFIGCDSAIFQNSIGLNAGYSKFPLLYTFTSYSYNAAEDSFYTYSISKYETPIPTAYSGQYTITDTLYNWYDLDFNYELYVSVTDTCNVTYYLQFPYDLIQPFDFYLNYNFIQTDCGVGMGGQVTFDYEWFGMDADPYNLPLIVTLTDTLSGMVVDSFVARYNNTIEYGLETGFSVPPQIAGRTYLLTVTDNCGDTSKEYVQWPSGPLPYFYATDAEIGGCIDSTGTAAFNWGGTGSIVTLQLLSGPSMAHSTKPGFAYSDTIIYPINFYLYGSSFSYFDYNYYYPGNSITISDMPSGTYTYHAFDSCGNFYSGSFQIQEVSSLAANYTVNRTCGGMDKVTGFLGNGNTYFDVQCDNKGIGDNGSIVSFLLPDTTKFIIQTYFDGGGATLPGLPNCWSGTDTIIIKPDSILAPSDVATCNGNIYIYVNADTINGVLPFKYEIISGPQTFPPQASNLFEVNYYGTYTVGVIDSCGDVDAREISVDSGRFSPVVKTGGWCPGSTAVLTETASPFFSYVWNKPDGEVFTGSTLVISPFTAADTGIYQVLKIVSINGCRDSALGSYHLVFRDTFQQSVSFCFGDTLYVGTNIHTVAGTYADTLSGVDGCDSIEVSTITYLSTTQAAIVPLSPTVCHTGPVALVAIGGITYTWSPGNYQTDTITVNPQTRTIYTLIASDTSVCSAISSVTIYPSSDSVVSITQNETAFCANDSVELCAPAGYTGYQWGPDITGTGACVYVKQTGNYYVQVTDSNGCIIPGNALPVSVYPLGASLFSTAICSGSSYLFKGVQLTGAGNYADTLQTVNGCDSIVVLHLSILSPDSTSFSAYICNGATYPFFEANESAAGTYSHTLQNMSGCDSVVTLQLNMYPVLHDSITTPSGIICADDSTELCAPAGFTSYQWSEGLTGTGDCVYAKQAGDYYVMATDSNGCSATSNHLAISVYPIPSVSIIVQGDTLTSFGQVSYHWILNDIPINGATGTVLIARQSGSYSVEVTDTNGCTTISNPVMVTGISNLSEDESVSIYPNPSTGAWQLAVSDELIGSKLEVYDDEGRLVFQSAIRNPKSEITLDVPSGVYYLCISNERVSVVSKMVKI